MVSSELPEILGMSDRIAVMHGGEIKGSDKEINLSINEQKEYTDPYLQYALTAARRALKDSGIENHQNGITRNIGLVLGTCNSGLISAEAEYMWKHKKSHFEFNEKMNLQAQFYIFSYIF